MLFINCSSWLDGACGRNYIVDASGWVNFSKGSSGGSKYTVLHKSMTFYGAQDQCRKFGGHLAHVESLREQAFLEEFLSQELRIEGKRNSYACRQQVKESICC